MHLRSTARRCAGPHAALRMRRAACATRSKSGKALLRKRGGHLQRGFAHMLDHGGLRRATLRGCENLTKRHLVAALSFNLSLLLRTIFGTGTAKQWLAGTLQAILRCVTSLGRLIRTLWEPMVKTCHVLQIFIESKREHQRWQLRLPR